MVDYIASSLEKDYYGNINRIIELAGRVCYKSENKMTNKSANYFIRKVINGYGHESISGHAYFNILLTFKDRLSMLEVMYELMQTTKGNIQFYIDDASNYTLLVGLNYRTALLLLNNNTVGWYLYSFLKKHTNNWLFSESVESVDKNIIYKKGLIFELFNPDLKDFPVYIQQRFTVVTLKFSELNRTFSHQLVRHMGVWLKTVYSEMSQRYVNPTTKLGSIYSIPQPLIGTGIDDKFQLMVEQHIEDYKILRDVIKLRADQDKEFSKTFRKPGEVARDVLPNAINTEVVVTATIESWKHFVLVRSDLAAQYHIRSAAEQVDKIITKIMEV